jgi:mono/diheme cytochrome c family protein
MKTVHGDYRALDVSERSPVLRRVISILSLFWMVIVVAAPVLIFGANHGGGQSAAHDSKSTAAPAGNAEKGKQLFKKYGCYECHGSHGQIVSRAGPALAPDLVPFGGFAAYIRRPAGSMPAYTEQVVSDEDLADIYAFLKSVSHPPDAKTVPLLNFLAGKP